MLDARQKNGLILILAILLPVALFLFWRIAQPFETTLLARKASLSLLSAVQRQNIAIAASRLNGTILEPGDVFSFNRVIGPRTSRRGYRAAPSYIADASPKTIGGGICLLSSALYGAALEAGFEIRERHAHLRPVNSVPPGLDAAVWYGQADIVFKNTLRQPVLIAADIRDNTLTLSFRGKRLIPLYKIYRAVNPTPHALHVSVSRMRPIDKHPLPVAEDVYRR